MKLFSVLLSLATAAAFSSQTPLNGREVVKPGFSARDATVTCSAQANSIEPCPPGSQNCIRTTWTPPPGSDKASSTASLRKVLEAYPQEGQDKIDLGGWSLVEDNFDNGSARFEFKSGTGFFAILFNFGQPFIDDLKLVILDSGVVEVRSSSRKGKSDLGVNQKRLAYIGKGLAAEGWTIPEPTYE
eukprot:scaffold168_cov124-Cylindrotheca_fusiformis.AAC.5